MSLWRSEMSLSCSQIWAEARDPWQSGLHLYPLNVSEKVLSLNKLGQAWGSWENDSHLCWVSKGSEQLSSSVPVVKTDHLSVKSFLHRCETLPKEQLIQALGAIWWLHSRLNCWFCAVLKMPSFVYQKPSSATHNNLLISVEQGLPAMAIFCVEREHRNVDSSFRKAPACWYRSGCLVDKRVKRPVHAICQVEETPDAHRQDGEEYRASQAAFWPTHSLRKVAFPMLFMVSCLFYFLLMTYHS